MRFGKIILGALVAGVMLCGCNAKQRDVDFADKLGKMTEKDKASDKDAKKETGKKSGKSKEKNPQTEADLTSEDGIRKYLAGDWTLYDRKNREDFAVLSLKADGSFEFVRNKDKAKASGTLSFKNQLSKPGEEPDMYSMQFDGLEEFVPAEDDFYVASGSNEASGGIFHFGAVGDEDYLYLKEIGNGESAVTMYVFNPGDPHEPDWPNNWLFYRANEGDGEIAPSENDTFTAWAWEIDEDQAGVWLQKMDAHEYEAYDDYSNRKFTGGYFSEESDPGAAYYEYADDVDFSGILHYDEYNIGYPLMMCEVTTDQNGAVKKITDVDLALYNVYDLGELPQDYSYKDMTFTINGFDIDMHEAVPAATAIMDCRQVGDWIIVECHVNPHYSAYEFYNVNDGLIGYFQYEIVGANLIWQGDDLSTAVYTQYNEVYDFWGHPIGSVQEGEIYELSFINETTVGAKCWIVDEIGREKEFTQEFEYEPCDSAVFSFYESVLGGSRQLRRFLDSAPDNASALVIVNPPEIIQNRLAYPVDYEPGALDKVTVVSLTDNQEQYIAPIDPGSSGYHPDIRKPKKGEAIVYNVTVPEGMPVDEICVATNECDLFWDVWTLSGRIPQMSTYLIEGD